MFKVKYFLNDKYMVVFFKRHNTEIFKSFKFYEQQKIIGSPFKNYEG